MGPAYPAELYAALHRGNEGDVDFYRAACSGARTVLELGCGYGRVLGELARAGYRVTGLEADAELAERARASVAPFGGRVTVGDMEDFDLGERFDRIVAPYHAIYCLTSQEAVLRCFARVRHHLAEGGLFVFDGYAADAFHGGSTPDDLPEDHLEPVGIVEAYGRVYDVFEKSRWEPEAQRIHATYLHVARDGSPPIACELPQRYLLADEVVRLLEAVGLEAWVLHGGFDQSAYDPDESEMLIVTARLPAS